jgi:hypothetical protein
MVDGLKFKADIKSGLFGRGPRAADLLRAAHDSIAQLPVLDWLSLSSEDADGTVVLMAGLHPAAEPLRITAYRYGRLVLSAATTGAGPGYHEYVCGIARNLEGTLGIRWVSRPGEGDWTTFWDSGDSQAVKMAMLIWLLKVARQAQPHMEEFGIGLSMGTDVVFESDLPIQTPMGPRDRNWLAAITADPRAGYDIFPWWHTDQDAAFYLDRALCRMWTDVRWRVPVDDAETKTIDRVLDDLESAHRMDPSRSYPVREWQELAEYRTRSLPDLTQAAPEAPLVGYRRRPVRIGYHGWTLQIPGSLGTPLMEDGFFASDAVRKVAMFALNPKKGQMDTADFLERNFPSTKPGLMVADCDGVSARAAFVPPESADDAFMLSCAAAEPRSGLVLRIASKDDGDRDWAVETWRSLRFDGPPAEGRGHQ